MLQQSNGAPVVGCTQKKLGAGIFEVLPFGLASRRQRAQSL
jgi:hypothetical protein